MNGLDLYVKNNGGIAIGSEECGADIIPASLPYDVAPYFTYAYNRTDGRHGVVYNETDIFYPTIPLNTTRAIYFMDNVVTKSIYSYDQVIKFLRVGACYVIDLSILKKMPALDEKNLELLDRYRSPQVIAHVVAREHGYGYHIRLIEL